MVALYGIITAFDIYNFLRRERHSIVFEIEEAYTPLPKSESNEPIVAWRVWRLVTNGKSAILRSCWTGDVWEAGYPMTAKEELSGDQKQNGVHAFKRETQPKGYDHGMPRDIRDELVVHGKISLWGRVIEHEDGYRAQFAYPTHIIVPNVDNATSIAQAIRAEYGCEVTILKPR